METGSSTGARADVPGGHPARARTLACALAAHAGLDRAPSSGGRGARYAHHWRMAGRLSTARSDGAAVCPKRWFPPALDAEAPAALKAAVQAPPCEVGLALANWNWKVVRAFVQQCGG